VAVTFGGVTGDDITWTMGLTIGGSGMAQMVYGWWMPSALNAGRGLWSMGNTIGAEIDTTTSAIRMRTDNTTDGQRTAPVGLAVNTPIFLAWFWTSLNTGSASSWRVWAGNHTDPPAAVTVTVAVASSGNFTGGSTFTIGNKGTGTLAFQGDIENVGLIGGDRTVAGATVHPFAIATAGAITAAEEQLIYDRFVYPAWVGEYWKLPRALQMPGTGGTGVLAWHHPLWDEVDYPELAPIGVGHFNNIYPPIASYVANGVTASQNRISKTYVSKYSYDPRALGR
jgi:hypothetical protein